MTEGFTRALFWDGSKWHVIHRDQEGTEMTEDEQEAHSIKWNVARIVRLSSGRFALLTHYRAGALDIIKVGTLEEIADHIPTAEQCWEEPAPLARNIPKQVNIDLADLGL